MEAIVLAGGLGTRLRSVVSELPKPMADINNKPFLEYLLNYLIENGIKKVILSVGYKYEVIKEYFGDRYKTLEIKYSIEDEPLGTGGAIKQAIDLISESHFYIINGDTFFDINLNKLSLKGDSKLALSLKTMENFDRYGCVEFDKFDYVSKFSAKGFYKKENINAGIYLASKSLFDTYTLEKKFSFEEFMQQEFKSLKITSKVFEGYFVDIGIPEDYEKAQIQFAKWQDKV